MGLSVGIVGLPNVGKSTLFNALTRGHIPASNYPFCTTKPNVGIVEVYDEDLDKLYKLVDGTEITYTAIKIIDIAGLIKGSSHGEGLGNQFLSEIRNVDVILHLVRTFQNLDIAHIDPQINVQRDIEIIELELALSDLELINRKLEKVKKLSRTDKKFEQENKLLNIVKEKLEKNAKIDLSDFTDEENKLLSSLQLLTAKPTLFVLNIAEEDISMQDLPYLSICAKLEDELVQLPAEEKKTFQLELGLKESVLPGIIKACFKLLDLITFYTVESGKIRAWSIKKGSSAISAAGLIHSDIARGFVRAEVTPLQLLMKCGSLLKARETGLAKTEGKDYCINDKDVIYFRFSGHVS